MIIDTEALTLRGPENISPALAANLLSDLKGIINTISLSVEGDPMKRGTIRYELLQAFGSIHDAERLIRKQIKKD